VIFTFSSFGSGANQYQAEINSKQQVLCYCGFELERDHCGVQTAGTIDAVNVHQGVKSIAGTVD
jgi:hypothetical protein